MKKAVVFLVAILLLCSSGMVNAQTKKMTTTLKGSISNPQRNFCLLRQQGRADTIKLGSDGTFELLIEQNTGNYYTIEHGKQSIILYLLPSDEVNIKLTSTSMLDAKELKGNSSVYIQYLIDRQKADKGDQMQFQPFKIATMTGDIYYAKRDSIKSSRMKMLDEKSIMHHFIAQFVSSEKKSLDYQVGAELLNFKTGASKMGTTIQSEKIDKYINGLSLNEEEITFDFFFRSFVLNHMAELATKKYYASETKTTLVYYEFLMDALCSNVTSEKNKSVLVSELMPQLMNDIGTMDLRKIVSILESCCSDKKLIASVKKAAAQYEYLYPGKPSPDAAFYDAAGNRSKISSYKGKVLYIDAWATWCGPCKREIPYLKTLEEEYHGKNVQFISVSTDKDVNLWKDFIAKQSMGGLQLHQSENFDETVSKMFIVNSIPRFIIIDEAGNIVNTDAPRPSSGAEIRNILDTLLAD